MSEQRIRRVVGMVLAAGLVMSACGGGDDDDAADTSAAVTEAPTTEAPTTVATTEAPTTTQAATTTQAPTTTAPTTTEAPTTTVAPEPLRIMVTNDDGVGAAGIDALVQGLSALADVEVTVIAPAENQSGTSDKVSEAPPPPAEAATASGFAATAIPGFPADTVIHAFDGGGLPVAPHLVVSGINEGQNMGPVVSLSGTIGAARTAARRGVPAIAVSAQLPAVEGDEPDWERAVEAVVAWVTEHRDALLAGEVPAHIFNFNSPNCNEAADRGVVEVVVAVDLGTREYTAQPDCVSELPPPADDVDALLQGYIAFTEMDPETLAAA